MEKVVGIRRRCLCLGWGCRGGKKKAGESEQKQQHIPLKSLISIIAWPNTDLSLSAARTSVYSSDLSEVQVKMKVFIVAVAIFATVASEFRRTNYSPFKIK